MGQQHRQILNVHLQKEQKLCNDKRDGKRRKDTTVKQAGDGGNGKKKRPYKKQVRLLEAQERSQIQLIDKEQVASHVQA